MTVKFLSEEWRAAVEATLKKELGAEHKGLDTSLNTEFLKCPDGKTRFFHMSFVKGAVDKVVVAESNPPKATFTITGNYNDFADLFSYKLALQDAITSGKFKLEGNMLGALGIVPEIQGIIQALSGVTTEF